MSRPRSSSQSASNNATAPTAKGGSMRGLRRVLILLAALAALSSPAFAQATLTGVVKDSSGLVLPGVTVEASSPALIERVRSAVTDGNGRYQIIDLRPGVYTVTFTLSGFATVRREA